MPAAAVIPSIIMLGLVLSITGGFVIMGWFVVATITGTACVVITIQVTIISTCYIYIYRNDNKGEDVWADIRLGYV